MTGHHISSAKLLWGIAISLFVLTFLTVGVFELHLPDPWNILLALVIAGFKAFLVAAFFMNLWWDDKFNLLLLLMSVLFFIILIGITLLDTMFRIDPVPGF